MSPFMKTGALLVYSLATIGSGLYRYLSAEGGSTGLIFGIVMGLVGLTGTALLFSGKHQLGAIMGALAIVLVGGWFCYESFVKKGIDQAEIRQLIMMGLSGIMLGMMLLPIRKTAKSSQS